jgi:hypothetical protein
MVSFWRICNRFEISAKTEHLWRAAENHDRRRLLAGRQDVVAFSDKLAIDRVVGFRPVYLYKTS